MVHLFQEARELGPRYYEMRSGSGASWKEESECNTRNMQDYLLLTLTWFVTTFYVSRARKFSLPSLFTLRCNFSYLYVTAETKPRHACQLHSGRELRLYFGGD